MTWRKKTEINEGNILNRRFSIKINVNLPSCGIFLFKKKVRITSSQVVRDVSRKASSSWFGLQV